MVQICMVAKMNSQWLPISTTKFASHLQLLRIKCESIFPCKVVQPLHDVLQVVNIHEEPRPSCNISKNQRDKIRTLMRKYRLKLGSEGYRMGGIDSSTGLTLKLIESIVSNCEFVKSAEEMVKTFTLRYRTLNKQTVYTKLSLKLCIYNDLLDS